MAWADKHFKVLTIDGKKKRFCVVPECGEEYSFKTSHIHLHNHWRTKHGVSELESRPNHDFKFHPDNHIDCLIKFIIKGRHKYKILEQKEFLLFAHSMNPTKNLISRQSLSIIVNENTLKLLELVKIELSKTKHVALTTDIWSARKRSRSFSVITGHCLDQNMKMKNLVLDFKYMPYPHDSNSIKKFLVDVLKLFDLENKLVSITSDNDSANISGIGSLLDELNQRLNLQGAAKIIHIRCMAHIIDLAIKEAIKQLKVILLPIEEVISTITSSTKRMERFAQIQQQLAEENRIDSWQPLVEPLKLIQDIDTRWNSKFLALDRALLLREAIDKAIDEMVELLGFEPIEWDSIKTLVSFLKPFHEMTEQLSGEKYSTMSLISSSVPVLISHAESFREDLVMGRAASSLLCKLYNYSQSLTNEIALIASVLDPRIKASFIVRERSALLRLKQSIKDRMQHIGSNIDESSCSEQSSLSSESIFDTIFLKSSPNEIDSYLSAAREAQQVNALDYWFANKTVYPELFRLAQNILSIQPTSVASERTFSLAGLIDLPRRNRLSSESFRSNMLLNSWLDFLDI